MKKRGLLSSKYNISMHKLILAPGYQITIQVGLGSWHRYDNQVTSGTPIPQDIFSN